MTDIDHSAGRRSGRLVLGAYTGFNVVLLLSACSFLWLQRSRAYHHGIAPNTSVGFRSQHTLASLRGWYVAQRVGFSFAATAATVVAVIVVVAIAVAVVRGMNPVWIPVIPIVGGVAVGVCLVLAGHRADGAAAVVETPPATSAPPGST